MQLHETASGPLVIGGVELDYVHLPPAGNRGLRFELNGAIYALTGDSDLHDAEIEFLRGVELAVFDSGHLTDEEILELAVATQARHLVCSHLYRDLDEAELNARARERGYRGSFIVGSDLMAFELGRSTEE